MRLLLDEMFSASIAGDLRRRGHDVSAVQERPEMIGSEDTVLLAAARAERRVLVTEDTHMAAAADLLGAHWGILYTSSRSLPRAGHAVGRLIRALDHYLHRHPRDDELADRADWLSTDEA